MLRIKWSAATPIVVAAVLISGGLLLASGAATPAARAGSLTQRLSAYVVATNPGPLSACSGDGSDCGPANKVWDYIHVVNRNPLVNQGGSRATVPNAFVIGSIDQSISVNGVQQPNLDTHWTPPPNITPPAYTSFSGRWPATVVCDGGPPCSDVQSPAVLPGEDTAAFFVGAVHDDSDQTGTWVFTYKIHGTLNGNPVDLSASSPPIQMNPASPVVVPKGQPVQIAFVGSSDLPDYTQDFRNAIQMAIAQHPTIRGFPIKLNESDPPNCGGDADANVAAATAIVSNTQNTAVIGNPCSAGFAPALPIYEDAGLVTLSGSATEADLPSFAAHVFNRTIVADPDADSWYAQVTALPSDLAFQHDYQNEFGAAPLDYTDLNFDAASLLLSDLQKVSKIVNGNLVISRAALANAVRNTTNYQGVSCTITLDPSTGDRVNDPASLAHCGGS